MATPWQASLDVWNSDPTAGSWQHHQVGIALGQAITQRRMDEQRMNAESLKLQQENLKLTELQTEHAEWLKDAPNIAERAKMTPQQRLDTPWLNYPTSTPGIKWAQEQQWRDAQSIEAEAAHERAIANKALNTTLLNNDAKFRSQIDTSVKDGSLDPAIVPTILSSVDPNTGLIDYNGRNLYLNSIKQKQPKSVARKTDAQQQVDDLVDSREAQNIEADVGPFTPEQRAMETERAWETVNKARASSARVPARIAEANFIADLENKIKQDEESGDNDALATHQSMLKIMTRLQTSQDAATKNQQERLLVSLIGKVPDEKLIEAITRTIISNHPELGITEEKVDESKAKAKGVKAWFNWVVNKLGLSSEEPIQTDAGPKEKPQEQPASGKKIYSFDEFMKMK